MSEKGEIEVVACHGDHHVIRRHLPDGTTETGVLARSGDPEWEPHAESYVELERRPSGRYAVRKEIRYTARSRPSTASYRKGWDATFGGKAN